MIGSYDGDFITPRLATGAKVITAEDAESLLAYGITHVVDSSDEPANQPNPMAAMSEVAYMWQPTPNDCRPPPLEYWHTVLKFALPALVPPSGRLLFHCNEGLNRGPSAAVASMMAVGWTLDDALALLQKARPQATACYALFAEEALIRLGYLT